MIEPGNTALIRLNNSGRGLLVLVLGMLVLALHGPIAAQPQPHSGSAGLQNPVVGKQLALSADQPPRAIADGAEVLVVSGYEAPGGRTKIFVDRPGKTVLLVLSSYENTLWLVDHLPSTKISGIVVSTAGGTPSAVIVSSTTKGFLVPDLPHASSVDNIHFTSLVKRLNGLFGINRIDAFRGSYTLPRDISIVKVEPGRPELSLAGMPTQAAINNFSFDLLTEGMTKLKWSLNGPLNSERGARYAQGKVTVVSSRKETYRISDRGLDVHDQSTGKNTTEVLPPGFPKLSWPTDLAYGPERDVITMATMGGEGFLYRYDAKQKQWLDFRSLNNVDITSLAFDELGKRYVAWTTDAELIFFSDRGDAQFRKQLIDLLPSLGTTYNRGNESPPRLTIVPRGNDIGLVYAPGGSVEKIWVYDVTKGVARLTYQASR